MGPLTVDTGLVYTCPYVEGSYFSPYTMWETVAERENVIGVAIMNARIFVVMYEYGWEAFTIGSYAQGKPDMSAHVSIVSTFNPVTRIGWVRTRPRCKDADVSPFALYMDKGGMATPDYIHYFRPQGAVECTDFQLYKQMLSLNKDIVYMTSNGPIFLSRSELQ